MRFKSHVQVGAYDPRDELLDGVCQLAEAAVPVVAQGGDGPMPGEFAGLADRVVLGSDFPNIPYPYEVQLDAIRSWGLDAAAEQAILHDNGLRLLQLSR